MRRLCFSSTRMWHLLVLLNRRLEQRERKLKLETNRSQRASQLLDSRLIVRFVSHCQTVGRYWRLVKNTLHPGNTHVHMYPMRSPRCFVRVGRARTPLCVQIPHDSSSAVGHAIACFSALPDRPSIIERSRTFSRSYSLRILSSSEKLMNIETIDT